MISSTESHIPCEVTCSTCGAGPDRRCGDAYGEFEAGVYCPGRQQDLMAALILDAETLAERTETMSRTTHSYSQGSTRTTCGARALNPASVGVVSHLNTDRSVPVGWDGVTCEECLSPTRFEYFTDDHGRAAVRHLEDDTELGVAAGSEFLVPVDTEDYAPETIAIAREWITDCLIEYTNDEDASCAHWSDERVMRYIEREYDNGVAGFLHDAPSMA